MELTIHALSHSYGDKKALTGFTHTFVPGITALLGPNGAGKSTLIHLICDLLPRQTGTIAFDGTDILSMGPAFRQVLGFMPQSQGMYDDMTAWEFLLYMAQLKGLRPRAAREQLRELLQVVNLWDAAHRRVGGFSGGMRQRVMIALSLACKPDILIADEPTTALDVTIQSQILDLIDDLKVKLNMSVIFITHDLGVVAHVADRVAVMYAGKIIEIGTAEEIFYNPQHPYTWGLICSMPTLDTTDDHLYSIPGAPPNMLHMPKGDAFAPRNAYALAIDFEKEPPFFKVRDTHYAATWLLHPQAPAVTPPAEIIRRQEIFNTFMKQEDGGSNYAYRHTSSGAR